MHTSITVVEYKVRVTQCQSVQLHNSLWTLLLPECHEDEQSTGQCNAQVQVDKVDIVLASVNPHKVPPVNVNTHIQYVLHISLVHT